MRKLCQKDSSYSKDQAPIVYQSPFTMKIHQVALLTDFNMSQIPWYKGNSDPTDHAELY